MRIFTFFIAGLFNWVIIGQNLESFQLHQPNSDSLLRCSQLLHPIDFNTFIEKYFEVQPLLLRRTADFYGSLFELGEIDGVLENLFGYTDSIDEVRRLKGHGIDWRVLRRVRRPGCEGAEMLRNSSLTLDELHMAFSRGGSLVVNKLQRGSHNVHKLTSLLAECMQYRMSTNMYVTPPGGQGLDAHIDWMDGLVLQLTGSKVWTLYSPPLVALPRPDMIHSPNHNGSLLAHFEPQVFTLNAGDILYIPRGVVHHATATASVSSSSSPSLKPPPLPLPSLHLTIGIETATHFIVQTLLHHAIREHFSSLYSYDSSPDHLTLIADSGCISITVPATVIPDFLHILVHCIAGQDSPRAAILRRSIGLTTQLGRISRFNVETLFEKALTILDETRLDDVLTMAVEQDLISIDMYWFYHHKLLEPLNSKSKRPTDYIQRFLSSHHPLLVSVDCFTCEQSSDMTLPCIDSSFRRLMAGHIDGMYNVTAFVEMIQLHSWKGASMVIKEKYNETLHLTQSLWTAFLSDGTFHRNSALQPSF